MATDQRVSDGMDTMRAELVEQTRLPQSLLPDPVLGQLRHHGRTSQSSSAIVRCPTSRGLYSSLPLKSSGARRRNMTNLEDVVSALLGDYTST